MNNSQNLTDTLAEVKIAEDRGQYVKAFSLLKPFWNDFEQFPNAVGLTPQECAELFLRFGSIIGFIGNSQTIFNSQEISKNLLTLARQRFVSLSNDEKSAECENHLALAYARTGEFTEASDWLNESQSKKIPDSHPVRIHSYVIETVLDMDSGKYKKLLDRCSELEKIFKKHATDVYNGCLQNQFAMAHKNLGNTDKALEHLKSARDYFRLAQHEIYYGAAENNLARWYHAVGQYTAAHECAERARNIFEQIGDKMREGFSMETRAQIFAAEGNYSTALKFVNEAVEMLEGGESYRNLVETYRTKITILLNLNHLSEALTVMTAAHNVAALYISQELSKEIIEAVAKLIDEKYNILN